MKVLTLCFAIFIFSNSSIIAQKYDYNWTLGDWFDGEGHNIINFETNPPTIYTKNTKMYFATNVMSASDSIGNLIFYSNGLYIRNRKDSLMKGSEDFNYPDYIILRKHLVLNFGCDASILNNMFFIPVPKKNNEYIIFHKSFELINKFHIQNLYFTTIDMTLDNGNGEVTSINVRLRQNIDGMALTKHANGEDWWLITCDYLSDEFFVYQIDSSGISMPLIYKTGPKMDYFYPDVREMLASFTLLNISPDGKTICRNKTDIGMFFYEFNRETGEVQFKHKNEDFAYGSVAFSHDSKYIYKEQWYDNKIIQYDIEKNELFSFGFYDIFNYRLAPDNKIYFSCGPFVSSPEFLNYLCYINRPELPAIATDPHINELKLPKTYSFGLPSYPNYRLGPVVGFTDNEKREFEYIYKFSNPEKKVIDKKYTDRNFTEKDIELLKKISGQPDDPFLLNTKGFPAIPVNRYYDGKNIIQKPRMRYHE
jgi:hypothetical protein